MLNWNNLARAIYLEAGYTLAMHWIEPGSTYTIRANYALAFDPN